MDLYTHLRLCSSATGKNINFQKMQTHGIVFGEEKKIVIPIYLLYFISMSEAPDIHVSFTSLKWN